MIEIFKALASEPRCIIIRRMLEGEMRFVEIADLVCLAQSPVSQHMRVLVKSGLVEIRKEGRHVYYSIVPKWIDWLIFVLEE